ncbi:hypothetical protein ACFQ3W_11305 [Paenibacillus puldeungensis]|uniref:Uncharacterized protein n=1 Tax=Paenibacillus puldeungensis TaxID=696536 RepID=A0ABW3RWL9_9BACL
MTPKVKAKSFWVWTDKAQVADPKRHVAGQEVWPHYAKEAPKRWLDEELIVDKSDYQEEGQADIFDYIEGV